MAAAPTLPAAHERFLSEAVPRLATDSRLVGVAAGGSYAASALDGLSDFYIVIAVEPAAYDEVMAARQTIAAGLGSLLVAFTGEHVGEPRLLICLYGPPLLHVDLKFVAVDALAVRVEDPSCSGGATVVLPRSWRTESRYPAPDLKPSKTAGYWCTTSRRRSDAASCSSRRRAELRAISGIGPMALASRGARPTGVRKLEQAAPDLAAEIGTTVAVCDARSCITALTAAIECYRRLRAEMAGPELRRYEAAEAAAVDYVRELAARFDSA